MPNISSHSGGHGGSHSGDNGENDLQALHVPGPLWTFEHLSPAERLGLAKESVLRSIEKIRARFEAADRDERDAIANHADSRRLQDAAQKLSTISPEDFVRSHLYQSSEIIGEAPPTLSAILPQKGSTCWRIAKPCPALAGLSTGALGEGEHVGKLIASRLRRMGRDELIEDGFITKEIPGLGLVNLHPTVLPDERAVFSASIGLVIFDPSAPSSGKISAVYRNGFGRVPALTALTDGRIVAATEGTIAVVRLSPPGTPQTQSLDEGHDVIATCLESVTSVLALTGNRFATAESPSGRIRVWTEGPDGTWTSVDVGKQRAEDTHGGMNLKLLPDGSIVSCSELEPGSIVVWREERGGAWCRELLMDDIDFVSVVPLPSGEIVSIVDGDGVYIWERDGAGAWKSERLFDRRRVYSFDTIAAVGSGAFVVVMDEDSSRRGVAVWRKQAGAWEPLWLDLSESAIPDRIHALCDGRFCVESFVRSKDTGVLIDPSKGIDFSKSSLTFFRPSGFLGGLL